MVTDQKRAEEAAEAYCGHVNTGLIKGKRVWRRVHHAFLAGVRWRDEHPEGPDDETTWQQMSKYWQHRHETGQERIAELEAKAPTQFDGEHWGKVVGGFQRRISELEAELAEANRVL